MIGRSSGRHGRVGLALVVALAAFAPPTIAGGADAHAASTSVANYRTIRPPRLTDARRAPPPSVQAAGTLPFHPRSVAAFKAAKLAAQAGKTGRRTGVIDLSRSSASTAAPRTATAASSGKGLQVAAAYTLTDQNLQAGWYGNTQKIEPPDTQLAAGPDHLVEMVNSTESVWSKSDGSPLAHFNLFTVFGLQSGESFTDPRVQYDSLTGLWFASGLSFVANANTNSSKVYLAVSQTSDPTTGQWVVYTISSSALLIQDQPKLGLTADKVVMTWNDFDGAAFYLGQETWVLQKSDVVAHAGLHVATVGIHPNPSQFNAIPAQSEDASTVAYLVENRNVDGSGAFARVTSISGTPANLDVAASEVSLPIAPTAPPPGARQGAGNPLLATNDDAFTTAAVSNGNLWLAGNDACQLAPDPTIRSCLRMIQLTIPGGPGVVQDVDLGGGGSYLFFPALAIAPSGDMVVVFTMSGDSSFAGVAVAGQSGVGPGSFASLKGIQGGLGGYSCSPCSSGFNGDRWGDYSGAALDPTSSDIWVAGEYATLPPPSPTVFTSPDWGTAAGRVRFTSAVLRTAFSTQQYRLSNSDGASWIPMDPASLALTITPTTSARAVLDANADLWTANVGINQDLAIFMSANGAADTLVGWKESGGYAGTFSPNAAFLQVIRDLTANTAYKFSLRWKANKPATGTTIFSGAGLGPVFSPTRLTARLVEAGSSVKTTVSTQQYQLATNQSWTSIDAAVGGLNVDVPATQNATAIVSANADLWTANAGFNQDLGLFVKVQNNPEQLVAWKESGGFNGTFSPNAAFVQTVVDPHLGFHVSLKWKANIQVAGGQIRAGAGAGPPFSPTRLTVELVPDTTVRSSASAPTQQYILTGSDGTTWQPPDPAALHVNFTATSDCVALIGVNADLWTETAGINQDLGVAASYGSNNPAITHAPAVIAWKESGGSAGTFSPNAAYLEAVYPVYSGLTYDFTAQWKANHPTGGTIRANAGAYPNFSASRLVVQLICS